MVASGGILCILPIKLDRDHAPHPRAMAMGVNFWQTTGCRHAARFCDSLVRIVGPRPPLIPLAQFGFGHYGGECAIHRHAVVNGNAFFTIDLDIAQKP